MAYNVRRSETSARRPAGFWVAALAGAVHTAITVYWAFGGHGLLWTMGEGFLQQFRDVRWLLFPVAVVKALAAFGPLWLQRSGWPWARATRPVAWLAAVILIGWGGLNTIVGNAVLSGLVRPADGYDRPVMIGHAWLWDPIFLVWGLGLAHGLVCTRSFRRATP